MSCLRILADPALVGGGAADLFMIVFVMRFGLELVLEHTELFSLARWPEGELVSPT